MTDPLVKGFKEDCETLLKKYDECGSNGFRAFSEVWKSMKFSLVFTCRENFADLLEFCEKAIQIALDFVILPQSMNERIKGLYLLYGIFYKIPVENIVKIRITHKKWKLIMELHNEIRLANHIDANYILSKLISDYAFHHCLFEEEMALDRKYTKDKTVDENKYSIFPEIKSMRETLDKLSSICKDYEAEKKARKGLPSLFNADFANDTAVDIQKFEDDRKARQERGNIQLRSRSRGRSKTAKRLVDL